MENWKKKNSSSKSDGINEITVKILLFSAVNKIGDVTRIVRIRLLLEKDIA